MGGQRGDRPGVFRRLGQVFQFRSTPHPVDREIDAEIDYHFARRVEDLIAGGMSRPEAEREAHRRFGDLSEHRRRLGRIDRRRESMERRAQWWEITRDNLRYGFRGLRQSPGFTITVVATLALGIGANATMFGVIDRLLLSPPTGIEDPDTIRRLYITRGFDRGNPFTSATTTYVDVREWTAAETFEITAFQDRPVTFGRGDGARRVPASVTDANFFDLLGVRPQLGRYFSDEEDRSRAPVIVISDHFWKQEFGADPNVLGQTILARGAELTIIGVGPTGFAGVNLGRVDAWLPLRSPSSSDEPAVWENHPNYYWLRALVRLNGADPEAGETEATAIHLAARLDEQGSYDPEAFISLAPLVAARGPRASDESKVAQWLTGVSVVVLLIACANVANLLLARALRRRREMGVRLALGVSRGRLIAQLVTESLMLSLFGGAAALVVAYWGAEIMRAVLLPDVHWPSSPINVRIMSFTVAASVGAGLLAGIVPALQSSRSDLVNVMRSAGRGDGGARSRTRSGLLVVQAALSALLLVGAGLFVRSLNEIRGLDLGIDPDGVVLAIPEIDWGETSDEEAVLFYRRAAERLASLPRVEAISVAASTPFQTSWAEPLRVPGVDELPRPASGGPYLVAATPGVFEALDLQIVEGRGFLPGEDETTAPVAVVDQTMARQIWPGESALGKCLLIGGDDNPPCNEVVGVVEDSRRQQLIEGEQMQYFVPLGQGVPVVPHTFFVRTDPSAIATLIPEIRRELHGMSSQVRYARVRPLRDFIDPQARSWSLGATMFTVFGVLALVIAAVGLYGVLAFNIVQRTHELGVRTALGATPERLIGMVLADAMRLTGIGLALGVLTAVAAGGRIAPLLYNVSPRDPAVLGSVAVALALVAAAAAALPAWRTTRIDPNAAFRVD